MLRAKYSVSIDLCGQHWLAVSAAHSATVSAICYDQVFLCYERAHSCGPRFVLSTGDLGDPPELLIQLEEALENTFLDPVHQLVLRESLLLLEAAGEVI